MLVKTSHGIVNVTSVRVHVSTFGLDIRGKIGIIAYVSPVCVVEILLTCNISVVCSVNIDVTPAFFPAPVAFAKTEIEFEVVYRITAKVNLQPLLSLSFFYFAAPGTGIPRTLETCVKVAVNEVSIACIRIIYLSTPDLSVKR